MRQAVSSTTTNLPTVTGTKNVVQAFVSAFRRLISPAIFDIPSKKTILVPVADDGWAPDFRCGEFAVIEVTWVEPADGVYVYFRGESNNLRIVQLGLLDENHPLCPIPSEKFPGPFWKIRYPRQKVLFGWKPSDDSWAPNGCFHMSDGPMDDRHLRKSIVGRATGVLGDERRALNWKVR
jgi:hypothetical protein